MTIEAPVLLTAAGDTTNATNYNTASITPSPWRLVLAFIGNSKGSGTADLPTLSGNGLTWVQVNTSVILTYRLTLFRAMGASPDAGVANIDFGGVGQTGCAWSFREVAGVAVNGTNGSGAIVQSAIGNASSGATSGLVTLASFDSLDNGTVGGFWRNQQEAMTAGTGFTKLDDVGYATPGSELMSEWRVDNDTTVTATWVTSSGYHAVAVEVRAAFPPGLGPAGPELPHMLSHAALLRY